MHYSTFGQNRRIIIGMGAKMTDEIGKIRDQIIEIQRAIIDLRIKAPADNFNLLAQLLQADSCTNNAVASLNGALDCSQKTK